MDIYIKMNFFYRSSHGPGAAAADTDFARKLQNSSLALSLATFSWAEGGIRDAIMVVPLVFSLMIVIESAIVTLWFKKADRWMISRA